MTLLTEPSATSSRIRYATLATESSAVAGVGRPAISAPEQRTPTSISFTIAIRISLSALRFAISFSDGLRSAEFFLSSRASSLMRQGLSSSWAQDRIRLMYSRLVILFVIVSTHFLCLWGLSAPLDYIVIIAHLLEFVKRVIEKNRNFFSRCLTFCFSVCGTLHIRVLSPQRLGNLEPSTVPS